MSDMKDHLPQRLSLLAEANVKRKKKMLLKTTSAHEIGCILVKEGPSLPGPCWSLLLLMA